MPFEGRGLLDADVDVGMAQLEFVDGAGHDRGAGRRERREPQWPRRSSDSSRRAVSAALELGQDELGMRDEQDAGVGEDDPAGAALEQGDPGLALERGDLLRDRRRGVGQRSAAPDSDPRRATSHSTLSRRTSNTSAA